MIKAKKIFGIVLAATIISSCGSSAESTEKASVEVSAENLMVADYAIEGMVCAMGCAATIQKDVADLSGVVNANVDYEAGKAHFEFDKTVISENEIISKIESIADGQYKVNEWGGKELETEEVELSEESEDSKINVSLPSFEIPNLFTLLLDQI